MKLTDRNSIPAIIKEMSIEEKLKLLTGETYFKGPAMEKYGIPAVYYLDGGTGANFLQMVLDAYERVIKVKDKDDPLLKKSLSRIPEYCVCLLDPEKEKNITDPVMRQELGELKKLMEEYIPNRELPGCFPPGIALGATWDAENIYECGRALAKESHYFGIDVLLGTPNVNIHRDPLGGRVFEGYSEDPCLVSKLAPAFVRGVQDEGIIANAKHFAANNQETDRRTVNEHIPVRALHEIYFPGFKACVQEGGCRTVMSAYNAINGEFCAHNKKLLTDILKKEWGFDGFVVSDWNAAYDQIQAWLAGNDVDMPGPRNIEPVVQAVKDGILPEELIDESVRRYLNVVLDMPAVKGRKYDRLDRKGSAAAAYNSIKEGLVLLKNENDTLPLDRDKGVCFFWEKSKQFIESGGGSANVTTSESTSMYDTMLEKLGADKVTFEDIRETTETVVITVGVLGQESLDRTDMDIPEKDRGMLLNALKQAKEAEKKTVVVLNVCGPVDVSEFVDDVDAMICVFITGMEGGRATADALLGEFCPSGKLPVTFPKRYRDVPSCGNFPGRNNEVWYGEGIFVGYRYYDYRGIEPRYPFGYGLSYTRFEIENVRVDRTVLDKDKVGEKVVISATVKNTGEMMGKEVVQFYVGEKDPVLVKPPKELKGFVKVEVAPGEEKEVTFELTSKELESFDEVTNDWQVQPDIYTIYVGTSSRSISGQVEIDVQGWNPYGIREDTTMGVIAGSKKAFDRLITLCPEGVVSREAVRAQELFQRSATLKEFWEGKVAPVIGGSNEEKIALYNRMIKEMNRFVI